MRALIVVSLGYLASASGASVAVPPAHLDVLTSTTRETAGGVSAATMKALVSAAVRKAEDEHNAAYATEAKEHRERSELEIARAHVELEKKSRIEEEKLAEVTRKLEEMRALLSAEEPVLAKKMEHLTEKISLQKSAGVVAELTKQLEDAKKDVEKYKKQAAENLIVGKRQKDEFETFLAEQNSGFKDVKRKAAQTVAAMLAAAKGREQVLEDQVAKSKKDIKQLSGGITPASAKVANIKAELASTLAATAQLKHDAQAVRAQRIHAHSNKRIEALKAWLEEAKEQLQELGKFTTQKNCV